MIAAPPLSSASSSNSSSSQLLRDRPFRRSFSLPPVRPARPPSTPRFSASCASATAERERERTADYYTYSRSYSSGGQATAAAPAGALAGSATLYDVLGLPAWATPQEIKAAYRRLALACHPDAAAAGRKGASADDFMRVHAAYATLSDPGKRAEYDRRVMAPAAATRRWAPSGFSWTTASAGDSYYSPPSPASPKPSSSSSSYGRRTWETDQCW